MNLVTKISRDSKSIVVWQNYWLNKGCLQKLGYLSISSLFPRISSRNSFENTRNNWIIGFVGGKVIWRLLVVHQNLQGHGLCLSGVKDNLLDLWRSYLFSFSSKAVDQKGVTVFGLLLIFWFCPEWKQDFLVKIKSSVWEYHRVHQIFWYKKLDFYCISQYVVVYGTSKRRYAITKTQVVKNGVRQDTIFYSSQ